MDSDSKVKIFIRNSNDGFSIERIFAKDTGGHIDLKAKNSKSIKLLQNSQ